MSERLDPALVGAALMNWLAASAQLGHSTPRHTIKYMHPDSPEAQFVKAMMSREPVADILDNWPELHPVRRFAER